MYPALGQFFKNIYFFIFFPFDLILVSSPEYFSMRLFPTKPQRSPRFLLLLLLPDAGGGEDHLHQVRRGAGPGRGGGPGEGDPRPGPDPRAGGHGRPEGRAGPHQQDAQGRDG